MKNKRILDYLEVCYGFELKLVTDFDNHYHHYWDDNEDFLIILNEDLVILYEGEEYVIQIDNFMKMRKELDVCFYEKKLSPLYMRRNYVLDMI